MIGVVVAAHGKLAEALLDTALLVVPDAKSVKAVGITPEDDSQTYEARLREAIAAVQLGDGVLLLTDMFGGSPSNIGLTLHQSGIVEVLTGSNLPMLVRALQLSLRGADLSSASREVKDYGRRAIAVASEVLGGGNSKEKNSQ